jgi:23S rRNA (pseudouridine1915-N3)-methyltransferase
MRLTIAAIGRLKDSGEPELVARYRDRIDASGRALALGPLTITEMPEARQADVRQRRDDEAARLLLAAERADRRVALDERGKAMSSEAFAKWLAAERDGGAREVAFLLGGPDGHGGEVTAAASLRLSLGAMTLPHGLARVILVEQLYRAITIISGHPYHRA